VLLTFHEADGDGWPHDAGSVPTTCKSSKLDVRPASHRQAVDLPTSAGGDASPLTTGTGIARGAAREEPLMSTVLLVDDVPEIRDVIATLLADEGFDVVATGSAEAALAHLAENVPDIMILDGRLPGMSGWACLDLIRNTARTSRLPVLMLTAAPGDISQYAGGPDDACTRCVVKPFDLDMLLQAISEIMDQCPQSQLVPA
jgi:CheY-like chemotaxis protein